MSWLPQDKLTTKEKDRLKTIQNRKDTLTGKYHTQIKSETTTHETWLKTFITDNTKKRVQRHKEYHENNIDKVELTIDDLQAYGNICNSYQYFSRKQEIKQLNTAIKSLKK